MRRLGLFLLTLLASLPAAAEMFGTNTAVAGSTRTTSDTYIMSGLFPEDGTITQVDVWIRSTTGTDSVDDYNIGLYTGGTSDSDILGATFEWQSGTLDPPTGTGDYTPTAVSDIAVSSGERLWFALAFRGAGTESTSTVGDWTPGISLWTTAYYTSMPDPPVAFDSTNIYGSHAIKAFITYTPAGGGGSVTFQLGMQHLGKGFGAQKSQTLGGHLN